MLSPIRQNGFSVKVRGGLNVNACPPRNSLAHFCHHRTAGGTLGMVAP